MDITVRPFILPVSTDSVCYLAKVEKQPGQWVEYVIDIEGLPDAFSPIFYDDYDPIVVREDFYFVNFYTLDSLLKGEHLYAPEKAMKYGWDELKQFMTEAVGVAVMDFVNKHAPHAVVAIPARPGLNKLYDQVLAENEQKLGYNYIRRYKEWGMYVIET